MASRNVLVRVYDSGGHPVRGTTVRIWVYQFAASGFKPEKYTDASGEVEFDLDIDAGADISISVDGSERVSRGSVRGSYRIEV